MIFHPDLCLNCVIDYHSKGEIKKLRKYERKLKKSLTCIPFQCYIKVEMRNKTLTNKSNILDDFTTTFHNFGRDEKITKWKNDKVIDNLIYKKLKKNEKNEKNK